MGSYSVLGGGVGVEVSNMSPAFSTGMQLQKPMYIMQEVPKAAQQQVWVHAVPASNGQVLRPAANPTMLQAAQPQTVPTVYSAAPRPIVAAQQQTQPMVFMTQPPGAMRLMQIPGGGVQLQQAQAQQQVVLAPQQQPQQLQARQPGSEVVYVNVNGVMQQGVMQNGSVHLMNGAAPAPAGSMMQVQAAPVQQAPMTVTVAPRQPGMAAASNGTQVIQLHNGQFQQQQVAVAGQQQVMMQQVVPAGARLVPVSQPAMRPAQLPQQQMQQQAQRPMMIVMQPNAGQPQAVQSSAPMGIMMVTGPQPAGMQQAAGARPQQLQMQAPVPAQQLMARGGAQQTVQPMQFTNGAAMQQQQRAAAAAAASNGMSMAGAAAAPGSQQASAQAFRPALAAGAKILMPGTSVSASTASLGNKGPAAAGATGPQQGQLAVPVSNSSNGSGVAVTQPVMVPGSGMQQQLLLPGANGEMSSPPAPPITPGFVMGAPALAAPGDAKGAGNGAGSSLLALLNGSNNARAASAGDNSVVRMGVGSQSPSHGVIGSQRSSKDGMGASRSGTPAPPGSSPPRSQPGTPARSNSGGGLAAASAAGTTGAAHVGNNKGAVMRLVARSFIETGIALEQALTMIQPADKELLAAAFAAEAAGAPLPGTEPAAAAASRASSGASETNGVGSMLSGLGVGFGGSVGVRLDSSTTDATTALAGSSNGGKGLFGGEGLSGLSSLSFAEDVSYANDNNSSNMGSWGFSLFTGSGISDLNGSTAGLSSLGPADPLLADVAAAPAAAAQPAGAPGKDSALAGMLASLNL
jgi:hypothetical protein